MMTMDTLALVGLSIACWASFAIAIVWHFARPAALSWRMKVIGILGTCFGLLQVAALVWVPTMSTMAFSVSVILYGAALALFWWTVQTTRSHRFFLAFTPSRPTGVVSDGPYQRVRHPFYTSYLMYWIAGVWATESWWLIVPVIVMGGLYWRAAAQEEAEFLASDQAESYRAYMATTGRFVPRVVRRKEKSLRSVVARCS